MKVRRRVVPARQANELVGVKLATDRAAQSVDLPGTRAQTATEESELLQAAQFRQERGAAAMRTNPSLPGQLRQEAFGGRGPRRKDGKESQSQHRGHGLGELRHDRELIRTTTDDGPRPLEPAMGRHRHEESLFGRSGRSLLLSLSPLFQHRDHRQAPFHDVVQFLLDWRWSRPEPRNTARPC